MMNYYQQNSLSNIIWVQGEAGAKSYLVAPNTQVQLWDSENPVIYIKSADMSGMPSIKVLDYTVRNTAQNSPIEPFKNKGSEYATKDDLEALRGEIRSLRGQLPKQSKPVRKGEGKLC